MPEEQTTAEMTEQKPFDPKAPMASAPMQYNDDGSVAWGDMWDGYCMLALDGGPPHRGEMLEVQENPNTGSEKYQFAVGEIIRGIKLVSGIDAHESSPGWIAVPCTTDAMAHWVTEAILEENVQVKREDNVVFVPVGDYYSLKGEIKNVITAVAKTTHYWTEHVPPEAKQTLALQMKMKGVAAKVRGLVGLKWGDAS